MKALTVQQPHAHDIARGLKKIENRTWYTEHRGKLAIHAAKTSRFISAAELQSYATGAVIAIVDLVDCVNIATMTNRQGAEGPYCWILEDPFRIPPIWCRGRQGLWEWDEIDHDAIPKPTNVYQTLTEAQMQILTSHERFQHKLRIERQNTRAIDQLRNRPAIELFRPKTVHPRGIRWIH